MGFHELCAIGRSMSRVLPASLGLLCVSDGLSVWTRRRHRGVLTTLSSATNGYGQTNVFTDRSALRTTATSSVFYAFSSVCHAF